MLNSFIHAVIKYQQSIYSLKLLHKGCLAYTETVQHPEWAKIHCMALFGEWCCIECIEMYVGEMISDL